MKILSVLLLLALGTGAAWWKLERPDADLDDARVAALALVDRARGEVVALPDRLSALGGPSGADATAGRGRGDGTGETSVPSPDVATALAPAARPSPETLAGGALRRIDAAERQLAADRERDAARLVRLEGLERRLETLAETVASSLAATPADDGDGASEPVADANAASEALLGRLDGLERRLDALARRAEERPPEERAPEPDAGAITTTDTTDRDALAERLDGLESRLATLAERDATFAARLDTLAPTPPAAAGDATGDAEGAPNTASGGGTDEPIGGTAPPEDGSPEAAEDGRAPAEAPSSASASADTDRDAGRDVARLESLASRLELRLATLETRVTELAERAPEAASIESTQAEIRERLATLSERVDGDPSDTEAPAIGEALEATRERLATLESRVQEMPASSAAADDAQAAQAALARQIRALEERLEALPDGPDPEIVSSISDMREQVDALNARDYVTQEELRAQAEGRVVEYKIYFDRGSTEVSPAAARVLDSFIAQEKNRTTGVSIFGFTDRQGSARYNQRLALERATAVRSYLVQNGLPFSKIRTLSGLGEDAAAAVLPDEAEDAQQRVVVLFAAQP